MFGISVILFILYEFYKMHVGLGVNVGTTGVMRSYCGNIVLLKETLKQV